jgi:putative ABC transport system permease protein
MVGTAFKFMKYDKPKSIGIIVGIVISIFLIGQQLGTLRYLTGLMGGLIENSNAPENSIWIIDDVSGNVNAVGRIDARIAQEVKSIAGVEDSYGIVIANSTVTFEGGKSSSVNLVGSDGPVFIAGPNPSKIIAGDLHALYHSNAVSAEFFDAKNYAVDLQVDKAFELNDKEAVVRIMTKNVQGFGGSYMFTNLHNARFFGNFPNDKLSMVVVKVKEGVDTEELTKQINSAFYGVRAWDAEVLMSSTVSEILTTSNMGVSFGSLIVFAMVSGFFIIGLTLYSSALDRLVDYGTLKAIGATNGFVSRLIFTQALLFAFIGLGIALVLLYLFKYGVAGAGLVIDMDIPLLLTLLGITLFMSLGGSLFAVVKISKLEPASIF